MKASELRGQDKVALEETLKGLFIKQVKLKMQLGNNQLPANHQLKEVRRDIARVKTLMTERKRKGE